MSQSNPSSPISLEERAAQVRARGESVMSDLVGKMADLLQCTTEYQSVSREMAELRNRYMIAVKQDEPGNTTDFTAHARFPIGEDLAERIRAVDGVDSAWIDPDYKYQCDLQIGELFDFRQVMPKVMEAITAYVEELYASEQQKSSAPTAEYVAGRMDQETRRDGQTNQTEVSGQPQPVGN